MRTANAEICLNGPFRWIGKTNPIKIQCKTNLFSMFICNFLASTLFLGFGWIVGLEFTQQRIWCFFFLVLISISQWIGRSFLYACLASYFSLETSIIALSMIMIREICSTRVPIPNIQVSKHIGFVGLFVCVDYSTKACIHCWKHCETLACSVREKRCKCTPTTQHLELLSAVLTASKWMPPNEQ